MGCLKLAYHEKHTPLGVVRGGKFFEEKTGAGAYRYGFNGKENDNEMFGPYNALNYGFRIYDPRIGRFLSVDPLTKSYPWYTPYQYAGNTPIQAIDLDGLEEWMMRQQLMLKRRAQLQLAADKSKASTTIGPAPPKTWQQNWRDDTNIFKKMLYDVANGFYTLPQQVTSSARGADYIHNIGGNVHKAHGIEGETQRVDNAVNAFSSMVPGAKAEEAGGKVLGKALGGILKSKFAQKLLLGIENQVTEQVGQFTRSELAGFLLTSSIEVTGLSACPGFFSPKIQKEIEALGFKFAKQGEDNFVLSKELKAK